MATSTENASRLRWAQLHLEPGIQKELETDVDRIVVELDNAGSTGLLKTQVGEMEGESARDRIIDDVEEWVMNDVKKIDEISGALQGRINSRNEEAKSIFRARRSWLLLDTYVTVIQLLLALLLAISLGSLALIIINGVDVIDKGREVQGGATFGTVGVVLILAAGLAWWDSSRRAGGRSHKFPLHEAWQQSNLIVLLYLVPLGLLIWVFVDWPALWGSLSNTDWVGAGVFNTSGAGELTYFTWQAHLALLAICGSGFLLITIYFRIKRDRRKDRAEREEAGMVREIQTRSDSTKANQENVEGVIRRLASEVISNLQVKFDVEVDGGYSTVLPPDSHEDTWTHLVEVHNVTSNTAEFENLNRDIQGLERASIGIAGERGSGKTLLMSSLQRESDKKGYLTLWMQAPTAYEEKEFLLSVLANLASQVGMRLTVEPLWPDQRPQQELSDARSRHNSIQIAISFSLIAVILGFALPWSLQIKTGVGVVIAGVWAWWGLARYLIPREPFSKYRNKGQPYLLASESMLKEIWYERKQVEGSGISVSGMGVGIGGSTSHEQTRRPFTLPRLVQMWEQLVGFVTTGRLAVVGGSRDSDSRQPQPLIEAFPKVVVFIDEVDKIKGEINGEGGKDEIGRFMRILKTLFRPSRLFFIVSISKDAYDKFQGKEKNEFHSSFDDVLWIRLRNHGEMGRMINQRLVAYAIPQPFLQLIWMLSRGNPRDGIRIARDILQNMDERKDLTTIAYEMTRKHYLLRLHDHHRAKYESTPSRHSHANLIFAFGKFLSRLETKDPKILTRTMYSSAGLGRQIDAATNGDGRYAGLQDEEVEGIIKDLENLRVSLYYALTICETFRRNARRERFEKLHANQGMRLQNLDRVRGILDSDGRAADALEILQKFRDDLGLPPRWKKLRHSKNGQTNHQGTKPEHVPVAS